MTMRRRMRSEYKQAKRGRSISSAHEFIENNIAYLSMGDIQFICDAILILDTFFDAAILATINKMHSKNGSAWSLSAG